MTTETIQSSRKRNIGAGIAGGIAGGAAMYAVMSFIGDHILGLGPNCFGIIMGMITGQPYESALVPGIVAHIGTSIGIGVIFGALISTRKFQIKSYGKGIGLGVAAGVIAFAVIFLPISMTVLPQHMMDLMKMMPMSSTAGMPDNGMSGNTAMQTKSPMDEKMKAEEMQKMMMAQLQQMIPSLMGAAFVSHIAFGATLGIVVTAIVKRPNKAYGR